MNNIRIGQGYDVHKLVADRPLVIGGVTISHEKGLAGHSDADVLLHAICDALLGAAALGDIGKYFPDTDQSYKNIDSRILMQKCRGLLKEKGYQINNIDATVVAQQPKLAPHIEKMRKNIAQDLIIEVGQVSVKATTSEKLGFEGRLEGISAMAIALIVSD
ncbi:MAG: 2-C-methyl-D-erythritol 2,4-cyclodiphosphate synthase [Balneolaceae bacterium]|nr:2-C-methyl-D-erythritol 2,4-cyclodiphosphate synthase [Balneolaceae bacterium]